MCVSKYVKFSAITAIQRRELASESLSPVLAITVNNVNIVQSSWCIDNKLCDPSKPSLCAHTMIGTSFWRDGVTVTSI